MSTSFVCLVEAQFTIMIISLGRTVAALAGCGKTIVARWTFKGSRVWGNGRILGRMLKKFVQQGRSTRRGDAYSVRYVEPLSKARTPLAGFFSILLGVVGLFLFS